MKSKEIAFKEKCWFLWGFRIHKLCIGFLQYHSKGEVCSVEFNWRDALGLSRFLLGWFHSHPSSISLSPSQEDQKTMRGWVRTLERPLICGIRHHDEHECYIFFRFGKHICQELMISMIYGPFFIGKIIKTEIKGFGSEFYNNAM